MRIVMRFVIGVFAVAGLYVWAESVGAFRGSIGIGLLELLAFLGGIAGVLVAWRVADLLFPAPAREVARRIYIAAGVLVSLPVLFLAAWRASIAMDQRAERRAYAKKYVIGECRQRGWDSLRAVGRSFDDNADSLLTARCDSGDAARAFGGEPR